MSLLITMGASAWFTRALEAISDMFDLSASLLSLLGALGANIPNYAASIVAIAGAQFAIGLGIIIGSNIYNMLSSWRFPLSPHYQGRASL